MGKYRRAVLLLALVWSAGVSAEARLEQASVFGQNDMIEVGKAGLEVIRASGPVGVYRKWGAMTGGCTGSLISEDLFLTALHCFTGCRSRGVTFGFHSQGRPETYRCAEVVERGWFFLRHDYVILRIEGKPGRRWGYFPLSRQPLLEGQPLYVLHHPGGRQMQLSDRDCRIEKTSSAVLYHRCDTAVGSSGAPVLIADEIDSGEVSLVGMHERPGFWWTLGRRNNKAVSIDALSRVSPTIRRLLERQERRSSDRWVSKNVAAMP